MVDAWLKEIVAQGADDPAMLGLNTWSWLGQHGEWTDRAKTLYEEIDKTVKQTQQGLTPPISKPEGSSPVSNSGSPLEFGAVVTTNTTSSPVASPEITSLLTRLAYPEGTIPRLVAELSALFSEKEFQWFVREASLLRVSDREQDREQLEAFLKRLLRYFRVKGYRNLQQPHPLIKLLVTSLNHVDIFAILEQSSLAPDLQEEQKAVLLSCAPISQLVYIYLHLLRLIQARAVNAPGHVFVLIPLSNTEALFADFSVGVIRKVELSSRYQEKGKYLALRTEYKVPASRLKVIGEQKRQRTLNIELLTEAELLHYFYFFLQITDGSGATPSIYNNLGIVLAASGNLPEAIAQYKQALGLNPNFAEAHNNLGIDLATSGNLPEAIAQYKQALGLNPNFAEAHNNLGIDLARLGNGSSPVEVGAMVKIYNESASSPAQRDVVDRYKIRQLLKKLYYPEKSLAKLEMKLLRVFSKINFADLQKEAAFYKQKRGNLDSLISRLRNLTPHIITMCEAEVTRLLVNSLNDNDEDIFKSLKESDLKDKEEIINTLLSCTVISQLAYILLALLGFKVEGALTPGHAFTLIPLEDNRVLFVDFSLGIIKVIDLNFYYESQGEGGYLVLKPEHRIPSERLPMLQRQEEQIVQSLLLKHYFSIQMITGKRAFSPHIYSNIGSTHARLGNYNETITAYRKAVELEPNDAEAHYNLGNAYAKSGKRNEAKQHFRAAVRLRLGSDLSDSLSDTILQIIPVSSSPVSFGAAVTTITKQVSTSASSPAIENKRGEESVTSPLIVGNVEEVGLINGRVYVLSDIAPDQTKLIRLLPVSGLLMPWLTSYSPSLFSSGWIIVPPIIITIAAIAMITLIPNTSLNTSDVPSAPTNNNDRLESILARYLRLPVFQKPINSFTFKRLAYAFELVNANFYVSASSPAIENKRGEASVTSPSIVGNVDEVGLINGRVYVLGGIVQSLTTQ